MRHGMRFQMPDAVREEPDYAPSAGGASDSKRKALKSEDNFHYLKQTVVSHAVPISVAAFVGEALEIFAPDDCLFA